MGPLLLLALLASAQEFALTGDGPAEVRGVAAERRVQSSWPGNRLYLWFLPSANAHFSPAQAKEVVAAGNAFLQRMSVLTRMTAIAPPQPFDASDIDKTDLVVLIGEKAEVLDFGLKSKLLAQADHSWVEHDWQGSKYNPEMGIDQHNGRKGVVLVSASGASAMTKEAGGNATKAQITALLAIHGAGHVAGLKHLDDRSFMDDGALLAANISGKGGFIMNGVMVNPRLTPIDDLFHAGLFDKLPASDYDRKYSPQNTQRKAWIKLFGSRAPSPVSAYCSQKPKHCL